MAGTRIAIAEDGYAPNHDKCRSLARPLRCLSRVVTGDGARWPNLSTATYVLQVPAGIHLEIELQTNLSSNSSAVGDPVDARLRWPLTAEGVELVPAGATLLGSVSEVEPAGKKKRGRLVFAFHTIEHPETGSRAMIKSAGLAFASDLPKKGNVYPELKLENGLDASISLLAPLTVQIPGAR